MNVGLASAAVSCGSVVIVESFFVVGVDDVEAVGGVVDEQVERVLRHRGAELRCLVKEGIVVRVDFYELSAYLSLLGARALFVDVEQAVDGIELLCGLCLDRLRQCGGYGEGYEK